MDRQEALRDYLREVARDLIMRGVIRDRQGLTPMQILKQEPAVVISSIVRDLKDAGFSIGQEILGGAVQGFFGAVFGGRR